MSETEKYLEWKQFVRDEELAADLANIEGNESEIFDRFFKSLDFGTAGLRGVLGAGTNRMNIYTVRKASQGLANYLKSNYDNPKIVVSYDSRKNSKLFNSFVTFCPLIIRRG